MIIQVTVESNCIISIFSQPQRGLIMDSLISVTVFGLLLSASGLVTVIATPISAEPVGYDSVMALFNNRSIAAFQRIAENRQHENIALSAMDTFSMLYRLYRMTIQSGIRNEWLATFFEPYIRNVVTMETLDLRIGARGGQIFKMTNRLSLGSTMAYRYGCDVLEYNASLPTNGIAGQKIGYTTLRNGVREFDNWYRSLGIETQFDEREFYGEECTILLGGSYFRQYWQPSDACTFRANFFQSEHRFHENVKYTRIIREFRGYGELSELNAKYIEVPWGRPKRLDEHNDLYVYVILPNAVDGLHELEMKITNHTIDRMLREARKAVMDVSLPEISLTRKCHLIPIVGTVRVARNRMTSGVENLFRPVDAVTVSKFEAFQAPAVECSSRLQSENTRNFDIPRFNANHPFLVVVGVKDLFSGLFTAYHLVRYWQPEQGNY